MWFCRRCCLRAPKPPPGNPGHAVIAGYLTVSAVEIIQVVGVSEQLNHVACPRLALVLQEVGQLAQVVLVAQGGLARHQGFVRQSAVMHQTAFELLLQFKGHKRLTATLGVTAHPGQCVGGQYMQPVQLLGHPYARSGVSRVWTMADGVPWRTISCY